MSGKKIVIVDYQTGNRLSIINSLRFLGYTPIVSDKEQEILSAHAIILPGVGSFYDAMKNIRKAGLDSILRTAVTQNSTPTLGICLGMQIMAKQGHEGGKTHGLNFFDAEVLPLDTLHVGYNTIKTLKPVPLFQNIPPNTHFYFDHAFHFVCDDRYISSQTFFKEKSVTASIQKDNIFATQFHPEKSQRAGLKLLRNFLNFVEQSS